MKFLQDNEKEVRLDMFILEKLSEARKKQKWTRSQIKQLIEGGKIKVSGKEVAKAGTIVKFGSVVEIAGLLTAKQEITPWEKEIQILYEDKYLIAINKPAGISMHPGAGQKEKTVVNALAAHFSKDLMKKDVRAGVVHRLDKDTTGVVVLAKSVEAHEALSKLFSERKIKKKYLALVLSTPRSKRIINRDDTGTIDLAIARDEKVRTRMSVNEAGRESQTAWHVKERMHYSCLMEIDLLTGRTHQIRVHFNHINSPVIGDKTYGDFSALPLKLRKAAENFGRQALHAESLYFAHPFLKKNVKLKADIPEDMKMLIDEFRAYKS